MAIYDTSIKRPIATTMGYLIVIVLGAISFRYLPVDLLPPIEFPRLTIYVNYPNVGPQEIETIITNPIENAVAGVPNIEKITSNSEQGSSRVTVHFAQGTNLDEAANDLRGSLDRLRDDLPPEAEAPGIWKFDPNNSPVVVIAARSDQKDLMQLTQIIEREIAKRFEQIKGVGTIDVWGGIERELKVELFRDRMLAYNLTAQDVQNAIRAENTNAPGGNLKDGMNDLYIRTRGEYENVDQIRNTVITYRNGSPIRIGDIARVEDGIAPVDRLSKVNDIPAVRFFIRKQTGANTVEVAKSVESVVNQINAERNDLNLFITTDTSLFIQDSINNVQNSALWGALLALFVLYLFLRNGSTTAIIAVSIPVSIIATFALLYFNGLTLNQMSFGGLALGVGLIVDNAIVVLENIVRIRQKKVSRKEAASTGTRQVVGAIIASTLTTSVIFLPVVFMQTVTGLMFQELAMVVTFSLICSLLVAMTLVPMLSSRFLNVGTNHEERLLKESAFHRWFKRVEDNYANLINSVLAHKGIIFSVTLILVAVTGYLFTKIPVELAPQTDADEISIDIRMANGTNIAVVNEYLKELDTMVKAILPMEDVSYVSTNLRGGSGEVEISLKPQNQRKSSSTELAENIRSKVEGLVPGADIRVSAQSGLWIFRRIFGGDSDDAIQVELRGYDLTTADELALEIKNRMEAIDIVTGVRVGRQEGRPEQNLVFDRERIAQLGLTTRDVAQAIQVNLGGGIAGQFRENGDEHPIVVRLRKEDRLTSEDLNNISVRTPAGQIIPVSAIVEREIVRGPSNISRINGQRLNTITANLTEGVALSEGVKAIQAELSKMTLPSGFSIVYGGEYEEQERASKDFTMSIIMALVLIYMVMAAQFERFTDPIIVMFAVPLALIGVVPTLMLTGTTLNMQSLMGLIMLIGIVVNNAIVLVDYINLMRREEGMSVKAAVIESGRLRLRPILMTTLTTIIGLLPLALGLGSGGEIQAALARTVIGGLSASTLITLVLIPIVYVAADNLIIKVKNFATSLKKAEQLETVEA